MTRIKVINDAPDMITIFRAIDTPVKKAVFSEASEGWITVRSVKEKYGDEGVAALLYFEKTKLVDTKWQTEEGVAGPQKAYHTFYTSVHINIQVPLKEITEVMSIALMPEKDFKKWDDKIVAIVGDEGVYVGDVLEKLGIEQVNLKSMVRRSPRLIYRGHRIEAFKG
ncbi:MAG: ArsR family transcriptional regulator [Candidatus Thermoplasmatota archaeon]|nr:ArsR family transcriptional regulator [Candidatus Thermoplasmatota archaeon]